MEGSTSGQNRKLEWNWRYFITWLRVISLYPLSNVSNVIALTIRFALWTINLVAHVAQLFLFYKLGYETASPTEYWNAVIDYWNWTVHNILILFDYFRFIAPKSLDAVNSIINQE